MQWISQPKRVSGRECSRTKESCPGVCHLPGSLEEDVGRTTLVVIWSCRVPQQLVQVTTSPSSAPVAVQEVQGPYCGGRGRGYRVRLISLLSLGPLSVILEAMCVQI